LAPAAAAQDEACSVLLTEDLGHDQLLDGVRVVNPSEVAPGDLVLLPSLPGR
jgi:hypothetical protein